MARVEQNVPALLAETVRQQPELVSWPFPPNFQFSLIKKNFQFNPRVKMLHPAVLRCPAPDFPPPLPPAALVPSSCVSRAERPSWSSAHMGSRSSDMHHRMLSGRAHIVPDTLMNRPGFPGDSIL